MPSAHKNYFRASSVGDLILSEPTVLGKNIVPHEIVSSQGVIKSNLLRDILYSEYISSSKIL